MVLAVKKVPPKRNTRLSGALYAPQFLGILAIGARYMAGLPSVGKIYDGGGRGGMWPASRGDNRIFPENPETFSGFSKFLPEDSGKTPKKIIRLFQKISGCIRKKFQNKIIWIFSKKFVRIKKS